MGSYCQHCGHAIPADSKFCPECGKSVGRNVVAPAVRKEEQSRSSPAIPSPGQAPVTCPGCKTTTGYPGDLCPSCGSRYPDPRATSAAVAIGGVALVVLLIGLAVSETMVGLGILGIVGAIALAVYGSGRVGPATEVKNSASCCGCSCIVLLIVFPSAVIFVWLAQGPLVAAAVIPVAACLSWCSCVAPRACPIHPGFASRLRRSPGRAGSLLRRIAGCRQVPSAGAPPGRHASL